jgi:hypothetical protein
MINKLELIGIAAVVAVGFASPAFAQRPPVAVYDSGAAAFDMVPGGYGGGYVFNPPANGGGSFGYNQNLRRDEW